MFPSHDRGAGQPGRDRSVDGVNPLVFSLENGNLINPRLDYDYSEEATFIYGTGKGRNDVRQIATVSDRLDTSKLNRREFQAFSNSADTDAITSDADNVLQRKRPLVKLSGTLVDAPATPYGGRGWHVGDKVTVSYQGIQFNVIIRSVKVRINNKGKETVQSRIESS